MLRWLLLLLDHRRLPWIAAVLAVLLSSPGLGGGLVADDWFHRAHLDDRSTMMPEGRGPILDLFAFFPTDPEVRAQQQAIGVMPWWFSPNAKGAFFRPLSALTHAFDWRIIGDFPWLHHAHSLAWMFGCVLIVGALFREWFGPGRVAALATLFFALDDAHAWPATWIANRNGLVALSFGAAAAWAHLRHRRAAGPGWLTALLLALALLSAEAGSATILLLLALEIGHVESWPSRVRRWIPLLAVSIFWALTWKILGYGIQGSGLYIDPVREPLRFLSVLPERVGALSAAAWLNIPVDFWVFLTPAVAGPFGAALGAVALGFVIFVARACFSDARLRQAIAVAVLCLLPNVAAFCMERVTTFSVLGVCGALSVVCAPRLESALRWRDHFVLTWHLPVSAAMLLAKSWFVPTFMGTLGAVAAAVPQDAAMANDQLVIVSGVEIFTAYIPIAKEIIGEPVPSAMLVIAPPATPISLTRVDNHSIVVNAPTGMFRHAIERLCRTEPFHRGETVQTRVANVVVNEVNPDGLPTRVTLRFELPLDSPRLRWLAPHDGVYSAWIPPQMGETLHVVPLLPLPG